MARSTHGNPRHVPRTGFRTSLAAPKTHVAQRENQSGRFVAPRGYEHGLEKTPVPPDTSAPPSAFDTNLWIHVHTPQRTLVAPRFRQGRFPSWRKPREFQVPAHLPQRVPAIPSQSPYLSFQVFGPSDTRIVARRCNSEKR